MVERSLSMREVLGSIPSISRGVTNLSTHFHIHIFIWINYFPFIHTEKWKISVLSKMHCFMKQFHVKFVFTSNMVFWFRLFQVLSFDFVQWSHLFTHMWKITKSNVFYDILVRVMLGCFSAFLLENFFWGLDNSWIEYCHLI